MHCLTDDKYLTESLRLRSLKVAPEARHTAFGVLFRWARTVSDRVLVILIVFFAFLSGCGDKNPTERIVLVADSEKVITALVPTPDDWNAALHSAYVDMDKAAYADSDGVRKFGACFIPLKEGKCVPNEAAFGTRDAFRKLRFYAPGWSSYRPLHSYLVTYISLKDYGMPSILMAPYLEQADWLFMEKMAIMVDGEVILEQSFQPHTVERELVSGGITERVDFLLSNEQINALRKITADSKVVVRLEGKSKYMSLKAKQIEYLPAELTKLIRFYDTLSSALKDKIPPEAQTKK
jgi:hypothetical protein